MFGCSRFCALSAFLAVTVTSAQARDERFPTEPNEAVTPGTTCQQPDEYRYPEHIAYCARSVSPLTKAQIIRSYDSEFGYEIEQMNRDDFKIDHFIPLCMGGSNEADNLWPQHKSVYVKTDPIEQKLCELMATGVLSQHETIHMIRHVKHNLQDADRMLRELDDLSRRRRRN